MNIVSLTKYRPILFCLLLLCVTARVFADGFIVIPEPPSVPASVQRNPFPLAVKYHKVDVTITDRMAKTAIDQVFFNPSDRRLEGEYIFPIPKGAVINNFSMYIDGKETHAEMLDAVKARTIYEEIVRKTLDPALLEYNGSNIFRVRIFPIEPKSEKRVKIAYTEILNKNSQTCEYLYPLNTEKFSSQPLESVSVRITVNATSKIKNIFSTTHPLDVVRKSDTQFIASWEEEHAIPNTDFKLYFSFATGDFGLSLLPHRKTTGDGFFLLDISPGFWEKDRVSNPKDVIFVLDTSGSMKGEKLKKAEEALVYCIQHLNPDDGFQIIRFSTEAESLFPKTSPADTIHKSQAEDFIRNMQPIGGTNIEEALKRALSEKPLHDDIISPDSAAPRLQMVVFITDGKPTIGEVQTDRLATLVKKVNLKNRRIFTFGIGNDLNTILLDKITAESRAYRTYIAPEEDITRTISDFFQKVERPVLTDIKINTISSTIRITKTHPDLLKLPDMFYGSSLTILGRYSGSGKIPLILTGTLNGSAVSYDYDVVFPETETGNETVASLWAARRIGYLLEFIRTSGDNSEVIGEITGLARAYGIITPYTSYLIIEDERARVTQNRLPADAQTLGSVAERDKDFFARSKKEFGNLKADTGSEGVIASEETQTLNNSQSIKDINSGKERLFAPAEPTVQEQKFSQMVQNVQGRAFYNNGETWIDSQIQENRKTTKKRIKFATKEYFDLAKIDPEAAQYLSLGRNIQFIHNGELYEIFE